MTNEQLNVIRELTNQGYAVIIWTPEELGNVSASWVEEMSISYGCEYLIPQEEDVA
jgi:hypothetical protein